MVEIVDPESRVISNVKSRSRSNIFIKSNGYFLIDIK